MRRNGFSLIELMVVVAIAGILLGLGVSSFNTMLATTRTRSTAESILSGLRLARSEAIRRNAPMRFQLVSSLDATCDYSTTSAFWVVTQTDQTTRGLVRKGGTGYCNANPFTPPSRPDFCAPSDAVGVGVNAENENDPNKRPYGNPGTCTDDPLIAYKSPGNAPPVSVTVAADAFVVTFGPLGQLLDSITDTPGTNIAPAPLAVTVSSSVAGAKSWRVRVNSPNGTIKFCDPALAAGQPLAC